MTDEPKTAPDRGALAAVVAEMRAGKFLTREEHETTNYVDLHEDWATRIEAASGGQGEAEDAARWRALIGSARIRPLGSAGIAKPDPEGYAHLGLELWTLHQDAADLAGETKLAVKWLTKYADIARATNPRTDHGQ